MSQREWGQGRVGSGLQSCMLPSFCSFCRHPLPSHAAIFKDRDLPGFQNQSGLIYSSPYPSQALCDRIAAIKAMERHGGAPYCSCFAESKQASSQAFLVTAPNLFLPIFFLFGMWGPTPHKNCKVAQCLHCQFQKNVHNVFDQFAKHPECSTQNKNK